MSVDNKLEFCDFIEVKDWKEEFDCFLVECYPPVELFGEEYSISDVMRRVDDNRYKILLDDYIKNCYDDYINGDFELDVEYQQVPLDK